jgi:hypothetical protein
MSTTNYQTPRAVGAARAAIEEYAEGLANEYKLTEFNDDKSDPLVDFVALLGGTISYDDPDDIRRNEDGSIVVDGPCKFSIFLSHYTGVLRDRFTIAHELGHYFLHSSQGETLLKATRKGDGNHEWEANWFAASLLMPKGQVKRFCEANGANPSLVAARFKVSALAAEYRLKNLGLLHR